MFCDETMYIYDDATALEPRGVTRLDRVQGKKQVWRPHVRTEIFRKQMFCIEESTWDFLVPP